MDCPPRGHFRRGDRFLGKAHTPGPLRPTFPAFLAGAGRPLLPPMIDYSVFSQLAAARGSIISGPVNRSATAFNFCIWAKFGLRAFGYWQSGSPLVADGRPGRVVWYAGRVRMSAAAQAGALGFANWPPAVMRWDTPDRKPNDHMERYGVPLSCKSLRLLSR